MQFLTAEIFVLVVIGWDGIQSQLSPDEKNVCLETETYPETIMVKKTVPRTIKKKHRCWNVRKFFSCEKTFTISETHMEPKVVMRSKIVARCCYGYVEVRGTCIPDCWKSCINGKCFNSYCKCSVGFYGENCEKECPYGRWGDDCVNNCDCSENGKCDKVSGCVCEPGWRGLRCDLPCENGYYGHLCENKCTCDNLPCDHKTGECITTTTETTTTSSPTFVTTTESETATDTTDSTSTTDTSTTDDTTHAISTSTETSIESHPSTDISTTSEISKTEIYRISDMNTERITVTGIISTEESNNYRISDTVTDDITETGTTTSEEEERISKADTVVSERVTIKEMDFGNVTEYKNEFIPTQLNKNLTIKEIYLDETTTRKEIIVNEFEVKINLAESEREFSENFPNTTEKSDTTNKEITNNTILNAFDESNITVNKTVNFTIYKENVDKNEIDNFIFEGKGSSHQETIFKWLHFLPSLSVLSAVSFLILIIAARWIIVKHRRKTKMLVMVAQKAEKVYQTEERVKFHAENVFWVNNCTVNPVYLTDEDLNNTTPVLETFKPVIADKKITPKEKQIL